MTLTISISKWRNGQGIRMPKNILKFLKLIESEKVEITTEDDGIKIKKVAVPEKRKNIKELFDNFNGTYKKEDIDWGEPQGKEI